MLLPGTTVSIRERILRNHLALAVLLAGKGTGHQLSLLSETAFLAWFLLDPDACRARREDFLEIERVFTAATHDTDSNRYSIHEHDKHVAVWLIDFHEQQLMRAPTFVVREAEKRLVHFTRSNRKTPWELLKMPGTSQDCG